MPIHRPVCDGFSSQVPLEGLAKMVADSVTSLLIQCQCGTAQGAVSAERWAGSGDKAVSVPGGVGIRLNHRSGESSAHLDGCCRVHD